MKKHRRIASQRLPDDSRGLSSSNREFQDLLDHLARLLAEEYISLVRRNDEVPNSRARGDTK
jgi:hypothetical protein